MRWTLLVAMFALPEPCERPPARLATFNIENFPRSDRQVERAFAEIGRTGAAVVGVQEVTDPGAFAAAARRELGPAWVALTTAGDHHRLGLLVDTSRATLHRARARDETRVTPGAKPTLEAWVRIGGAPLRVLVVHLKAGPDPDGVRVRQVEAVAGLVAEDPGEVVVLGDFNTRAPADRAALDELAARSGLEWTTRGLACTAFWDEPDGCRGAALDQVLAPPGAKVRAAGPCADGCPPPGRCPTWRDEVSDHCPLVVEPRGR